MYHVEPGHRKRCRRWDLPYSAHYLTFSCLARRPFFRSERAAGWFFEAVEQARTRTPFDLWSYVHGKIKHVHENPVRRRLVESPGDWPWSSWRAWELGVDEPLRIDRDSLPPLVQA